MAGRSAARPSGAVSWSCQARMPCAFRCSWSGSRSAWLSRLALTLMACYGMPPCDAPPPEGSTDPYHCYDQGPPCDVLLPDGGVDSSQCAGDAGTQPTDGGGHGGH